MLRTLAILQFMLLFALSVPLARAEDSAVMPPPTAVQSTPEASETVDSPATPHHDTLSDELNASKGETNVEIRTSVRQDGTRIDEYSRHGHVYMIKVSPPHGMPPYYLYDDSGNGKFRRLLPGAYKHITPPEWVIQNF
jgi:Protein of unknown function (DUF2782)